MAVAAATAVAVLLSAVPTAVAVADATAADPPEPPSPALVDPRVTPARAFFGGREVRIEFGFEAAAPVDLQVDVVREATLTVERRYVLAGASPLERQQIVWDGLTGGDRVAPGGSYRIRVSAVGGAARPAGGLIFRSHVYPIRGPHQDRGPIGAFGTSRSGGRTHEGFDVDAACATPVVAARAGRVTRAAYDPVLYGNLIIVRGDRTKRHYWYAHLLRKPRVSVGDSVRTGQRIGSIGATGNARSIGCHLHFEIRSRGVPIDPERELRAWDRWTPAP